MKTPILKILCMFCFLAFTANAPCAVSTAIHTLKGQRSEVARPEKAIIEALDLKKKTIVLNGKTYKLAKAIRVFTYEKTPMPLNLLHVGLVIEYLFAPNDPQQTEIAQIQLLSEPPNPPSTR